MVKTQAISPEGFLGMVGEEHQMLMKLHFRLPNGKIQLFRALVDTGAQVNLMSDKCVPFHLSHPAEPPVRLVAANGQVIEGGQRSVDLDMLCEYGYPGQKQLKRTSLKGQFLVANIDIDVILAYPWLREHELGVFPHLNALAWGPKSLQIVKGVPEPTNHKGGREGNWIRKNFYPIQVVVNWEFVSRYP